VALGAKSDTVRIVAFSLKLEDTKGELGAAIRVHCNDASIGTGLIEGENLLLIREAKVKSPSTECSAEGTGLLKLCKSSSLEAVEAVHLPWDAELNGGGINLANGGAGEPGWKVKCAGVEDTCTNEEGSYEQAELTNKLTAGILLVGGPFLEASKSSCTVGGKEAGKLGGFVTILEAHGNGISVKGLQPGALRAEPNPVNFGQIKKMTETTFGVTITSRGFFSTLKLLLSVVTNAGEVSFSLVEDKCKGKELARNEKCEIKVKFKPEAVAAYRGALRIPAYLTVPLRGEGIA
jgi:hypothetical protein